MFNSNMQNIFSNIQQQYTKHKLLIITTIVPEGSHS